VALQQSNPNMSDRKQILVFIVSVLLISWAYEVYIVLNGGVQRLGIASVVVLMWIPGLLSILMRLIAKSGFRDVRFVIGKPRYYVYALCIPLALALLTGALCAVLDIRQLALIEGDKFHAAVPIILSMLGIGLIGAFGEELGWRGFLLPKMVAAGIAHPYLLSGIVWACWHLPLIAFGDLYATDSAFVMTFVYGLSIVAMSFSISELRMRSESVWVATVFHAAHNFFFQLAIPNLIFSRPGPRSELWDLVGGDSGFIVAVLYVAMFVVLQRAFSAPARKV
jgi:uncharacterized protein